MDLPGPVRALVDRYLDVVDRTAPGLVEMVYLTGSVALGDYQPGASDVDFLALTARPVGPDETALLSTVHGGRTGRPYLDGVYLDRAVLVDPPDAEQTVPHVMNGVFRTTEPCGELNPVLWLALARYGIAVRKPGPAGLGVRVDPYRLRRWSLDNLDAYWAPLADQIRTAGSGRTPHTPVNADAIVWAVLGPPRLHYTLATGDVLSKSGAGAYVADRFPAWADLAARAVAARHGSQVEFTITDGLAAAGLVDAVVADAHRAVAP